MSRSSRWVVAALCASVHASAVTVHAQWQSNTGPAGAALGAIVGGDVERYLRALALAGMIKPVAWGARPFGPDELREMLSDTVLGVHPWQVAMRKALGPRASLGGMLFASANSGFPWGANDGAMWQGRGLTAAVGGSAAIRWGPVVAVAAPVIFGAQNANFELMPTRATGISPYSDPLYGTLVDAPQRMGNSAYGRIDPGESSITISLSAFKVGLSTASIGWGTGESFAAILGPNAGGFQHAVVQTRGGGLRVPSVGILSAQYIIGVLDQSRWSPVSGSETFQDAANSGTRRMATGLSVTFSPALLPGLEVGANRFYHSPFRSNADRWKAWSLPFQALFKRDIRSGGFNGDPTGDADNQLASLFLRWAFPKRGVEANLELFREDHNWDSRDLAEEPENNSAVLASVRSVMRHSGADLTTLTLEYFDGDIRPIGQARAQGFLYEHSVLRQGHTQRGQLLGSPVGVGAVSGSRLAWERFRATGSTRVNLQRWRTRSLPTTDPEFLSRPPGSPVPYSHDWILDGSFSHTRYTAAGAALTYEAGIAWAGAWQLRTSNTNLYLRFSWGGVR